MSISLLRHARLLPLLLGLAACQSPDSRSTTTPDAPAADSAATPAASPTVPATKAAPAVPAAPFTGYHRYVGTVGTAPVVLELTVSPPGPDKAEWSASGTYYYERKGAPLILSPVGPYQPGQPLVLAEGSPKDDDPAELLPTGRWQATQPAGPVLSGTWLSPDGRRRLPFRLREDYAGAVRYELLRESVSGPACPPQEEESGPHRPEANRTFLHLLGPDTLQPALRALQCPLPRQRRDQLAVELDAADCEGSFAFYGDVQVALNGYGLLSLQRSEGEFSGGAYPNSVEEQEVYELRTGQLLKLGSWLRTGQERALRRLIMRHLRAHPYASGLAFDEATTELPALGFDSEGVYCLLGDFGAPHAAQGAPVVVPYRELRPLVQPGSAVARMLQQRGLW